MNGKNFYRGYSYDCCWEYGDIIKNYANSPIYMMTENSDDFIAVEFAEQFIGLYDCNDKKIFEGDIVKVLDKFRGIVTFKYGTFGIVFTETIDYSYFEKAIPAVTDCDNKPHFCCCDNFVSFWELMWNYNQEEHCCEVVEVIGNIHDGIKQENDMSEGEKTV